MLRTFFQFTWHDTLIYCSNASCILSIPLWKKVRSIHYIRHNSTIFRYNFINCVQDLIVSSTSSTKMSVHMQSRRNSYFMHKYSPEVEDAVNKQIQAEQQAAQDYLSMAVTFLHPKLSRPGAGGFFMRMYEEEIGHMLDLVQYQLLRGGAIVISGLDAPKTKENLTLLEAFTKALEMEKSITQLLENLVSTAESKKDYQCADLVTSVYLAEQMKSVNEMSNHVTKLLRLCDEHSIYHYDLDLLKTHPYTFKKPS